MTMKLLNPKSAALAGLLLSVLATSSVQAANNITLASASSSEANLIRVCKALKSNSKLQLHKAVKRTRVGYRQIAKGLVCNGKSAFDFAQEHNADKTASLIARKGNLTEDGLLAKR